jgi:uncharacterized protein (DUF1778 family)
MPRIAVEDNSRMSLRIRAEEKALLLGAVALNHTDLTDFVLRHALLAAKAVIEEADHVQLSGRDSLPVLNLLENPPAPNAKLLGAARAFAKAVVIVTEWHEEPINKKHDREASISVKKRLTNSCAVTRARATT